MLRTWLTVAVCCACTGTLAVLINRTNAIDAASHEYYAESLRELRSHDREMENELDDVRSGDLAEYPEIDSAMVALEQQLPRAFMVPRFVDAVTADSLELHAHAVLRGMQQQKVLLAQFEPLNRKLHAGIDSVQDVHDIVLESTWSARNPTLMLRLEEEVSHWMPEARNGGRRSRAIMDTAQRAFRRVTAEVQPEARLGAVALADLLEELGKQVARVDALQDSIEDAGTGDHISRMRDMYDDAFAAVTVDVRRAERQLSVFSIALLLTIFVVLIRLHASRRALHDANGLLEIKVRERTLELEAANDQLKAARDAALEASVAKSQFLANMSHELRTPLNSVIGFTNVLLKNKRDALNAQEMNFLTRILDNGRHLLGLINDVLDLSKIEAGKIEVQLEPVRLDELIASTVQQFGADPKGTGVKLRTDVPAHVATIPSDSARVKQILINLIGNALKFTEQGSVTVSLKCDPISGQPKRIDVTDTGIGIPADRQDAIFDAFQQADSSTTRNFGGTGLGLTISSSLAQLMDCRIDVRSELNVGSTFSIVLPARQALLTVEANTAPVQQAIADIESTYTPGTDRELVMIIDDDPDSRLLMTQMLEEEGYEVLAANSGPQGLRMAQEFRPRAILLDLMMPGMSGFDVLRELKHNNDLCDIPVIVVSIVAKDYSGALLGAVDVVEKPLAREELISAVRRNVKQPIRRILVVDDNRDSRRLISSYLACDGVVVETAADGMEALAAIHRSPPDAIVIDLLMPRMGGSECIRSIRRDARVAGIPIVVVTASDLTDAEVANLQAATAGVLRKGEDLERDLKTALQSCIGAPALAPAEALCA